MDADNLNRFRTGAGLHGRLLRSLMDTASAGAVLPEGTRIGPWRVRELLGSGGMSNVYLAERADGQFEQLVALKLVRGNRELINRLRHERQVLAGLRHPNIVNLLDGGETEQGDLWFAMALVEGTVLDEYVRARNPGWRERLWLFDAVCSAVEYAHGRALIHRDIKPANILVDEAGHVRLLDFGIALDERSGLGNADHALTPGFASPEQLSGQELSTRSDIFQLGMVLDVLLSNANGTDWIDLPATVRRDLQTLHGIAVAADPSQRYATVAALREDLGRLLARRPLASQRDRFGIRWARAFERNRLATVIAILAIMALAVSLTFAAWRLREERNQAIANEERARAVAEFLVKTLRKSNPGSMQGDARQTVRELLLRAGDGLEQEMREFPWARIETGLALAAALQSWGETAEALRLAERAIAEIRELPDADPALLGTAFQTLASAQLAAGQLELAEASVQSALETLRGIPTSGSIARDRRAALTTLAQIFNQSGRELEALELRRQDLVERQASLGPEHPELASAHYNLGVSYMRFERYALALESLRAAERLMPEGQATGNRRVLLLMALTQANLGLGRIAEAKALQGSADTLLERWFAENQVLRMECLASRANLLAASGRLDEAYATSATVMQSAATNAATKLQTAALRAVILWYRGDRDALRKLAEEQTGNPVSQQGSSLHHLFEALTALGAIDAQQRSVAASELAPILVQVNDVYPVRWRILALLWAAELTKVSDPRQAQAWRQEAEQALSGLYPPDHPWRALLRIEQD